jgi:hypothetical protein
MGTKLGGALGITPSMNKSSSYPSPARCYQKNRRFVSRAIVVLKVRSLFSQVVDGRRMVVSWLFPLAKRQARHLIPIILAEGQLPRTTAYLNIARQGYAMSFGPGLTAETIRFHVG